MYLYGASGHGKVIKDILEAQGMEVDAFIDDNLTLNQLCDITVLHQANDLSPLIVSIGVNSIRKRIVERLNCQFGLAIHPSAIVSPSAKIGEGTVIMPGAIINADAVVGNHCIINSGASIDHECIIGNYCHIAPHATLCGQVQIGEGTLIGVGASIIPCISIGRWCSIGAGSVIISNVSDFLTIVGVPGRIISGGA